MFWFYSIIYIYHLIFLDIIFKRLKLLPVNNCFFFYFSCTFVVSTEAGLIIVYSINDDNIFTNRIITVWDQKKIST